MPKVIAKEVELNLPLETILEALVKLSPGERRTLKKELRRKKDLLELKKSFEDIWAGLPKVTEEEMEKDVVSAIREVRTGRSR